MRSAGWRMRTTSGASRAGDLTTTPAPLPTWRGPSSWIPSTGGVREPCHVGGLGRGLSAGDRRRREGDRSLTSDRPTAYGARAICLADAGDLEAALADANRAIELGRVDAFAYYTRGLIHAERGDASEATADLRHAIELAPTVEFADGMRALMADDGLE